MSVSDEIPATCDVFEAKARLERAGVPARGFIPHLDRLEYAEAEFAFYGDGGLVTLPELDVAEVTVVLGDLVVAGSITDGLDMDGTFLGVTGSVRARNLATVGRILILGDLVVEGLLYGSSGDHGFLEARSVRAHLIAQAGHRITAREPPEVRSVRVGVDPALDSRLFVPEACTEEGLVDQDRVFDLIGAGREALRASPELSGSA